MESLKRLKKLTLTNDQLSNIRGGIANISGGLLRGANKNKATDCKCGGSGSNDNNKNKAYECECQG